MRHVKFHFKSEQIILNYIMLEPKIKFNDKKQKYMIFFQEAIKLSLSLMGHHTPQSPLCLITLILHSQIMTKRLYTIVETNLIFLKR